MRLLPRKTLFFDLLDRQADTIVALSQQFVEMIDNFTDLETKQAAIKDLERAGDRVTHEFFNSMHGTFVTPLDKDDMAALASGLDDVADLIDAAAERLLLYKIDHPTAEARDLAHLMLATVAQLADLVRRLRELRDREAFFRSFREIHDLENQSDTVYRRALGNLFNAPDVNPIYVLKWKEIYERMETSVDKCEDVANVIEGIVLKYA